MKLLEIVNSQEGLSELLKLDMPIKKAYELRKFIISVESELKAFNQTKDGLIKKYGEEFEGQTKVKEENISKFYSDLNEILSEEIDIVIPEISIDDIEGKIKTNVLLQLTYLIK